MLYLFIYYYYQPLCKTLKWFSRIWCFLRSSLPWIIWWQWSDVDLINCNGPLRKHVKSFGMPCKFMGGLNGNGCLGTWKKPQMWPIIFNKFNLTWGVKGLIVTQSDLVVTWKDRPQMITIYSFPLGLCCFGWVGCILGSPCNWIFQFVPKEKKRKSWDGNVILPQPTFAHVIEVMRLGLGGP